MTAVNEEEEATTSLKVRDPRSCNERSDSGFSECSNCSTPSASCVCNLTLLDKNQSIVEEQNVSSSSSSSNEPDESTASAPAEQTALDCSSDHEIPSEVSSLEDDAPVLSIRVPTRRELLRDEHGDLLSEVERRKVALEQRAASVKHEIAHEKTKTNSKVALLLEKFETSSSPASKYKIKATVTSVKPKGLSTNPMSVDVKFPPTVEAPTNFCSSDSRFSASAQSPTRTPTSPTTFRLSNRVREVTERLSRPKQQPSMEHNAGAFVRSKEFWKR